MDNDDTGLPINSNLKCHVCGENEFEEREGFYYCLECGTKQEQVRLVEVIHAEEFTSENVKQKKIKIKLAKAEKPQLTSWECYNYILRGFVEELLSIGAKEELKLMTLQVWAAYLRRMEVAFFNRKQADLPKLGIKYLQNDATTIYNHSKEVRKKRRRRSEDASFTSGGESLSTRDYRKSLRKLDESNYSFTSATSGASGFTSSTSANSNRAIKIGFNVKARSFFKRAMPKKHLEKHAADGEGVLTCHKQPTARKINRTDYSLMLVNIKQIYSILAIALNLIGDEIQLCDLIRFINEGHIGTANVLQYFPENIANHGKAMLKKINFYKCPDKYSDKCLRDHVSMICKNIGIRTPKQPDIVKLVRRYTTDLCLPSDIADYIDRLINLLPPQFEGRTIGLYGAYEARAMAYIIFTLKLLFGLDGSTEHRISHAAQKLNLKIGKFNAENCENQPHIFVWTEWVEYIEMRKVIVSQFNSAFCEQFQQCQSTRQVLEQMAEDLRRTVETDNLLNETNDNTQAKQKLNNFRSIFERFQESYSFADADQKPIEFIEFKPTFTPGRSYLKNIFLFYDKERTTSFSNDLEIPDYMRVNHDQRNIKCYLQVKPLIAYFKKHHHKLNVYTLAANKNNNYVGIFRAPRPPYRSLIKVQKANFDITEEDWAEFVKADVANRTDDLIFKTEMTGYTQNYVERQNRKAKNMETFNPFMNYDLTMIHDDTDDEGDNENMPNRSLSKNFSNLNENTHNEEQQSMHSFELFSENNMDPIDNQDFITKPRRNLENINLFEGISDDESILNDDDGDENIADTYIEPSTSTQELHNFAIDSIPLTPSSIEEFIKVEPNSSQSSPEKEKRKEQEKDNKCNELKFYTSKMDCWMMLGHLSMLTRGQRSQLQDKFPRSFNWLLETCAQTINVDWSAVYDQLLCIELMFGLGIKDPNNITNCVYINGYNKFKDIQAIINTYREIW